MFLTTMTAMSKTRENTQGFFLMTGFEMAYIFNFCLILFDQNNTTIPQINRKGNICNRKVTWKVELGMGTELGPTLTHNLWINSTK